MTPTSHPEPPEVDEAEAAVHAVLDGEATPAQRRLVARDPRLVARVEELREVAAAVAAVPPPPPPDVLDRLRAAVLDAAADAPEVDQDEPTRAEGSDGAAPGSGVAPTAEVEGDTVTPLAPRRAARTRRRWPALPAVAAAVLVLMAIGIGLIVTDGDGGDEAATEAAGEAADDLAVPELDVQGSYPSQDALREALQEADAETLAGVGTAGARAEGRDGTGPGAEEAPASGGTAEEAPAAGGTADDAPTSAPAGGGDEDAATEGAVLDPAAQRCDTVLRSTDERIGPAQAAVVVEVDGTPMLVLSNRVDDGAGGHVQLTVLDATGCVPQLAVRR